MPIAQNLKYWQDIRHMTTAELAENSGVPDSTITKIRSGVTQNPNMDTLKRLAKSLDISINDLTDAPSVDDSELRDLLPKKLPGVSEELLETILTTLRNQRIASERTLAELRKDRNFWRKFAVVCLGMIIPVVAAILVLICVLYWDLSHPSQGNITLTATQAMSAIL